MTAKNPQSSLNRLEFTDYVPNHLYVEVFEAAKYKEDFYVCTVDIPGHKDAAMYMERSAKGDVIRVFSNLDDVLDYIQIVSKIEKTDISRVKYISGPLESFASELKDIVEGLETKNKKLPVKLMASGSYKESLIDLGIVWTNIKAEMQ